MLTFRSSWGSLHILRRLVPSWRPCHGFSSSPSPPGQGSWRRTSWTYKPGWCPANWGCPRTSLLLLGSLLRQKSATDGSWDRWRFGNTKGEICVKKGDFWGDWWGFGLVWESANPPTHIWEKQKKRFFLDLKTKHLSSSIGHDYIIDNTHLVFVGKCLNVFACWNKQADSFSFH